MLAVDPQTDPFLSESEPVEEEVVREGSLQKPSNVLRSDKVSESRAAMAKTGVIYLSRIPPRLSPTKIRQLLTPFGSSILRIFLAPESTAEHTRRVKAGGSKRRQFTEGWVEFEDKKVAKKVAGLLNAQRIGTKKGDFWYDDLWCIKYLPKFKWHHLTEQIGIGPKIFYSSYFAFAFRRLII
jgi:ESF2/ABP1 family protein